MDTLPLLAKLSPSITKMIRLDHTHVMLTSHRYTADASPDKKQAIVKTICLALEVHAQLEEEIFYPALLALEPGSEVLAKSRPEHDEMRRLIAKLRSMEPTDLGYDTAFAELMRDVLHHVADEETVLLPMAEARLKSRLSELGARMTQRRLQLAGPRAAEMVMNGARAMPASTMLMAGGLIAGAYLLGRRGLEHRHG